MNPKVKFSLAVALQILVLIGLIASRQGTLASGRTILLETVPVDPRSLFQGDYVVLSYKISTVDPGKVQEAGASWRPGETVYVTLRQQGKYWEAVAVHRRRPRAGPEEVVIKGRWNWGNRITYGIESYFVPEGQGREIERRRGQRGEDGTARLSVEVAVDRAGRAAIRRLLVDDRPSQGDRGKG